MRRIYFKIEGEQERLISDEEFYELLLISFPFEVSFIIKNI